MKKHHGNDGVGRCQLNKRPNGLLEYDTFAELVAIDPKHEKQIKKQFKYITTEFSGCVKDMIDKIECLGREVVNEKLKIDALKLEITNMEKIHLLEIENNNIVHEKELLTEKNNTALLRKDLEIAELRNQILSSKTK